MTRRPGKETISDASDEAIVDARSVRHFRLVVVGGAQHGTAWASRGERCSLGSHPSNDFVLGDPTVSRFHCEVFLDEHGAHAVDLGSRNGTLVDGVRVKEGWLRPGSLLVLGRVTVAFELASERHPIVLSESHRFGQLVGGSTAMRATFAWLEKAAPSQVTVLLEGETGTGKGKAAEAMHDASPRRAGPYVTIDCGAIPPNLLESELFGHEKGAFTGAGARRAGAFEAAHGGTIFLDEIGELSVDLQPKLLRVLEAREVRRLGATSYRPIDVRLIAATNRDLRAEVNSGRFRSDLYFRIAVIKIVMPALRRRPEDVPLIARELVAALGASPTRAAELLDAAFVANLQRAAWPGNVRELRNYLERCLVFERRLPLGDGQGAAAAGAPGQGGQSYAAARQAALASFERGFAEALLEAHHGSVAAAATAAGMDRVYLHKLVRRHGIARRPRGRPRPPPRSK